MTWTCIGTPPAIPPCGAHGTADTDAEKHSKATQHGTTSGTERGVRAIAAAFGAEVEG